MNPVQPPASSAPSTSAPRRCAAAAYRSTAEQPCGSLQCLADLAVLAIAEHALQIGEERQQDATIIHLGDEGCLGGVSCGTQIANAIDLGDGAAAVERIE